MLKREEIEAEANKTSVSEMLLQKKCNQRTRHLKWSVFPVLHTRLDKEATNRINILGCTFSTQGTIDTASGLSGKNKTSALGVIQETSKRHPLGSQILQWSTRISDSILTKQINSFTSGTCQWSAAQPPLLALGTVQMKGFLSLK
ncbi:rho GTPase-activating protein 20-like [Platysternon megacephalum]|uniref:Rho GTPase-activating protein 20-like n=1 Tax=Platysternon megacephalum TaxID=55544 RepID=A0A4D9F7I9_9SAUR|nr:rho GTPase-activating protein 20-like [Platysternon megacephalum]